jgi:lysophospholipase L1-like esterase
MQKNDVFKEIVKGLVVTVVGFVILEALLRIAYFGRNWMVTEIPLTYVFGDDHGPIPPWLDGLRILEPDKALIWKNRPNSQQRYIDVFSPARSEQERTAILRQFLPQPPDSLKGNPRWEISLNSEGFRDVEIRKQKPSSVFRVICLGDSWTFGWNVGPTQSYPQQLQDLLRREFPEANFEVLNLGVAGYSSIHGLRLLKTRVLELNPDVLVVAFAMNEPHMAGVDDKNASTGAESTNLVQTLSSMLNKSESFKLLRYWALLLRWKPRSISEYIEDKSYNATWRQQVTGNDFDKFEPWTKDSLRDYDNHHREMIKLARSHNISIVLLYNEFWKDSPYLKVLQRISREENVPLVDSSALIAEAQKRLEEELEKKLDLQPRTSQRNNGHGEIDVVFRVFANKWSVPKAMYIVGNHPKLGNLVPNRVAMYDDGTHGDQTAGDHVWSYSATFERGTKLSYVYTNSGEEGKWEGLDIPHVRSFTLEAKNGEEKLYRPIESFGKIYMHADPWHTNAVGYELIAKCLLDNLKKNEQVKDYLRQAKTRAAQVRAGHDHHGRLGNKGESEYPWPFRFLDRER